MSGDYGQVFALVFLLGLGGVTYLLGEARDRTRGRETTIADHVDEESW